MNGASQAPPCFKLFGTVIVSDETHQKKRPTPTHMSAEEEAQDEAEVQAKAPAALPCPRCKSRETKFCYFNNYNVNQPRHFCKACHRYWTAGGALRNVPACSDRRRNRIFSRTTGAGSQDVCAEADRRLLVHEQLPAEAAVKLSNGTKAR